MSNTIDNTAAAIKTLNAKRYVRVSGKLSKRSAEVAVTVRKKMEELDIKRLNVEGVGTLVHSYGKTSAGYYDTLSWATDVEFISGGDLERSQIGNGDTGDHMFGDFNHFVRRPTRDEVLQFSLNLPATFKALAMAEMENTDKCNAALSVIDSIDAS